MTQKPNINMTVVNHSKHYSAFSMPHFPTKFSHSLFYIWMEPYSYPLSSPKLSSNKEHVKNCTSKVFEMKAAATAVCNNTKGEVSAWKHPEDENWPWARGFCLMYSLRTEMFLRRHCRACARRSFTGSLAHRANTARYSRGSSNFTRARCNFCAKIWRTW